MSPFLIVIIYLAFIGMGLPDSLLGSAWPSMYPELGVPVSYSGIIFIIISVGTVVSSLLSDNLNRRVGTPKITFVSMILTTVALLGFAISHNFIFLCIWAIPYGLGAGSVDAALNNFIAMNFTSKYMTWLHCMWGIGATMGPVIMGWSLMRSKWNTGYLVIGILQLLLTIMVYFSLPLWRDKNIVFKVLSGKKPPRSLSLKEVIDTPGTKAIMISFFGYAAAEQTVNLWASTYLTQMRNFSDSSAAKYAGLFFLGITLGRVIGGFITVHFTDEQMVRIGQGIMGAGVLMMILPFGPISNALALIGLVAIGLGCAPIYPSMLHATPSHFGADRSQSIIGVQMAAYYVGTSAMPPLFGMISRKINLGIFPWFLLLMLVIMIMSHERMNYITRRWKFFRESDE